MKYIKMHFFIFVLILSACATGPTKEDIAGEQGFLDELRACGERARTIARVDLKYTCRYLGCEVDICAIKVCDESGKTFQITRLEIDQGRCVAEFSKPTD